jgi:hypothetical protein
MITGQYLHDGSLSGPVGPQEAQDLVFPDGEGNVLYRLNLSLAFCKIMYFYHWQCNSLNLYNKYYFKKLILINNPALKLPRVSGFLGIKPFATNQQRVFQKRR